MAQIDDIDIPKLIFPEAAAPGTPAAGKVIIYSKSDGLMYQKDDAGTETQMGPGSGGIPATIFDAKGDIIAASAADTAARLAVGANDLGLVAASGEATGLKWAETGRKVAIIQDQKAQNTAGGTFTSGAWQTRVLNTEVSDTYGIVAIASNQFTPVAGTYLIRVTAPAYKVGVHQSRLQNVTAASTTATGMSALTDSGDNVTTISPIDSVFTANGTDAYEVQHRCGATGTTYGFGLPANLTTEVYTSVVLIKIG